MRKEGYCAYGAGVVQALLERLQAGDCEALFRLQVCLSLFRACYPPTRLAYWKRRIRRCLRALNALNDHQQLLQWVSEQEYSPEQRAGIQRVQLRLSQRIANLLQRADEAWQSLLQSHTLNEMRGLSRRWTETHASEPPCPDYIHHTWKQFVREHQPALASETMALDTRWGRLHTLIVGAEILGSLLENPVPCEWLSEFQKVGQERFVQTAQHILQSLWESEQEQVRQFYGHTRPLQRLRLGWELLQSKVS